MNRTVWLHLTGSFRQIEPGKWEEQLPGQTLRFEETACTTTYIDIRRDPDTYVRLYDDHCELKRPHEAEYSMLYEGSWQIVRPPIARRNLIYHVCALADNDGWRHNIRQLLRRAALFNGRRVIAIVRGEGIVEPAAVRHLFKRAEGNWEFLELPNDRELREVITFLPLLCSIANTNSDEATFYAHTKGNSTAASVRGSIRWRNAMYRHLLDHAEECVSKLQHYAFVGCHKMVWGAGGKPPYPSGLSFGSWFLAGTFYWFRHDRVFTHSHWRNVPVDRYGAEAWPAGMFNHCEAASVYQKYPESQNYTNVDNPYNPDIYEGEGLDDEPMPDEPPVPEFSITAEAGSELLSPVGMRVQPHVPPATLIRPAVAGPKTVIVVGTFRGGTSFVGEQLALCGVPLGSTYSTVTPVPNYISYEDAELATALDTKDFDLLKTMIAARNAKYDLWGFKKPSVVFFIDKVLPLLRNPHIIVVLRDPLASHQSGAAHGVVAAGKLSISDCRSHFAAVMDIIDRPRSPTLAISYERGKAEPSEVRAAIRNFLSLE